MTGVNAFQDLLPHNHCYGCGPDNRGGLKLKSYWNADGVSVAEFLPQPIHCAAAKHFVNGGVLATLVDCHGVCTAMADAYRRVGKSLTKEPLFAFATGSLTVKYPRPTPMGTLLNLEAEVCATDAKQSTVDVKLSAGGKVCVSATVVAVRVPESWLEPA